MTGPSCLLRSPHARRPHAPRELHHRALMSCTAVEEAVLLSCDIPTRQYILHVDREQQRDHKQESFVIRQLDPTHLYVKARVTPEPGMGRARVPTGAVPFAQARCMALLESKLKELQALRRSLQPASPHAHATPHSHHHP